MKTTYTCARCGETYNAPIVEAWGTQEETTGYGPVPVCVKLVDRPGTPPEVFEVCRGQLIAAIVADNTPAKNLKPITATRR